MDMPTEEPEDYRSEYAVMLLELQEDVEEGVLSASDHIQILRASAPITVKNSNTVYYPVVDWYYDHKTMCNLIEQDLLDETQNLDRARQAQEQYLADREFLEDLPVFIVIDEMRTWARLF